MSANTCSKCTYTNDLRRICCEMCGNRLSDEPIIHSIDHSNRWECGNCQNMNSQKEEHCIKCRHPFVLKNEVLDQLYCWQCGRHNVGTHSDCLFCSAKLRSVFDQLAIDWKQQSNSFANAATVRIRMECPACQMALKAPPGTEALRCASCQTQIVSPTIQEISSFHMSRLWNHVVNTAKTISGAPLATAPSLPTGKVATESRHQDKAHEESLTQSLSQSENTQSESQDNVAQVYGMVQQL